MDIDCNQRGQTSCFVTGLEIQTHGYFKANARYRNLPLDFQHFHLQFTAIWGARHNLKSDFCIYSFLTRNLTFLLRKDLSDTPASSNCSRRPRSPRAIDARKNFTEHCTIQKDSIHGTVGAVDISSLLSSLWYSCWSISHHGILPIT